MQLMLGKVKHALDVSTVLIKNLQMHGQDATVTNYFAAAHPLTLILASQFDNQIMLHDFSVTIFSADSD